MIPNRTRVVVLLVSLLVGILPVRSQESGVSSDILTTLKPALESIRADRIFDSIKVLASDRFEGRNVGTAGEALTVDHLVSEFKRAGLKPGNPDGTYVQNVPLVGYRTQPRIELDAKGIKASLNFPDDFVHEFPRLQPQVSINDAEVVFGGYGIVAPEYGWDDYKGIDVRNKLVIFLGGEPSIQDKNDPTKMDSTFFKGDLRTFYSTMEYKKELAAEKGAAAVLFITDPEKSPNYSIFKTFALLGGFALEPRGPANKALAVTGLVTISAARRLFAAAGQDLDALQSSAQTKDFKPVSTNARANISVISKLRRVKSQNVVARIEGSDPRLKDEYLVYTAHWDHLGMDKNLKGDQIYNGAIDNAIGTAEMLAIARGLARLPRAPKRSILFIATTAEEKGWLGSRYYVQNPLYPLSKTIADINLDGGNVWGRTKDVNSSGYGYTTLDEYFEAAAQLQGRTFPKESMDNNGLYFGSDNVEFARGGVPAFFAFGGFEYTGRPADFGGNKWNGYADKDYHKVSDEIGPDWDLSGAAEDAQWLLIAGYKIAQAAKRPEWKAGSEFKALIERAKK
ncbi:MAG TPA: M28 family peptidase [Pyrinomonadaceae bacterium]|nr:M28 family peptidase [Acidobacteriota bacterium]HQZ97499.1 M28 family peptidase [Pyrinomonadaceae bacterium]